jgi:hypothetical protein
LVAVLNYSREVIVRMNAGDKADLRPQHGPPTILLNGGTTYGASG